MIENIDVLTAVVFLLLVLFLMSLSAFFAMSETALVGLSKIRLRHLVQRGKKDAKRLQALLGHMDEVITTIVMANNFVNTAISSLGAALCVAWLGPKIGVWAATALMGTLILVLGEITPKVLGIRHAEKVALRVTPIMWVLMGLLKPFTKLFSAIGNLLLKLLGVDPKQRSPLVTEEEIKLMIELGKKEGVLGEHERQLLHRIFEFGDVKVKDVMIPKKDVVMVSDRLTHEEVLDIVTERGHSRIPVYQKDSDDVTGILYAQQLLHIWREGKLIVLQDLLHPPYKVNANRRVHHLLEEFQRNHIQVAIVVDDKGKMLGLVTLEDLIEEIVGEIEEKPLR